jgi:glycosyltransferase involved in cell wall biosynthesis
LLPSTRPVNPSLPSVSVVVPAYKSALSLPELVRRLQPVLESAASDYELTLTLDDDLQHPPEEIPKLLKQLGPDTDVVYGTPAVEQHGLWRDMATPRYSCSLPSKLGLLNGISHSCGVVLTLPISRR